MPRGRTASERRGRRFFEDVGPNPADGFTSGLCSHCHSGPLLNQTNEFADDFIGVPTLQAGERFMNVGVSFFNRLNDPVRTYLFTVAPGVEIPWQSADPGRSLITGVFDPLQQTDGFKISPLRGISRTAPYFHDNSAKTLADVAAHYAQFFAFVTGPAIGLDPPLIQLTAQDQADIVAFLNLLE